MEQLTLFKCTVLVLVRYDITGLEAGTAIYARVSAHTLMSYGYSALSTPEFAIPSHVQPGAPPAVRLWASSESFITVRWDHPTVDGGEKVRHVYIFRPSCQTSSQD